MIAAAVMLLMVASPFLPPERLYQTLFPPAPPRTRFPIRSSFGRRPTSVNIPPAPPKSPILIIILLAVVGAVLAAIGYIWVHL